MPPALNLIGKRFGRLVALQQGPRGKSGRIRWLCRCDCGNEKVVERTSLTSGATKSCGCLAKEKQKERGRSFVKEMTGKRFGRWQVLGRDKEAQKGKKTRVAFWRCVCDCGTERAVAGQALRNGTSQSCGCLAYEMTSERTKKLLSLPKGQAAFNELFGRYKRQAQNRGLNFNLTKSQFRSLVSGVCCYCGAEPQQVVQARYGRNGGILYNGVDRLSSEKGYEDGNVVSCCGGCNRAKSDMTRNEFQRWVTKVYFRWAQNYNE